MMEYNGSALVAMAGDHCVAIASDKRLGINRFQTVSMNFQKIYRTTEKSFLGLAGLATDVQSMEKYMKFRLNLYKINEDREIPTKTLGNFMGHILYSRRFSPWFVQPIVCGLDEEDKPFISQYDSLGSFSTPSDFVVAGNASHQLYGACEGLFKKDMDPESLFECISNCLIAAIDRDCVSGWGGIVHIL